MIIREENDILDTDKVKFYERQLKFDVKSVLNYLKIGWKEYDPYNLVFRINDKGELVFYAEYKNGFELDYVTGDLYLKNTVSSINKRGKQITNLGTWLFNLNIDGATSFLNSIEDTVDKLGLVNVDLLDYTNTEIKFSGTIIK
jgi:hypothetical protein